MPNPVDVVVEIGDEAVPAGRLWTHRRGQTESATFAYFPDYIAHPDAYALDPQLELDQGQFQTAAGRKMFGAFTDCAPDRWGRRLINRDERNRAQAAGTTAAELRRDRLPPRRARRPEGGSAPFS